MLQLAFMSLRLTVNNDKWKSYFAKGQMIKFGWCSGVGRDIGLLKVKPPGFDLKAVSYIIPYYATVLSRYGEMTLLAEVCAQCLFSLTFNYGHIYN